jgi:hypothetical protein
MHPNDGRVVSNFVMQALRDEDITVYGDGGAGKIAIFAAKLLVTGACFWYVSRQIDWRQVLSAIPLLDFRWAALATLVAMLQIPLAGLRWHNIVDALVARDEQMTRSAMIEFVKLLVRTLV